MLVGKTIIGGKFHLGGGGWVGRSIRQRIAIAFSKGSHVRGTARHKYMLHGEYSNDGEGATQQAGAHRSPQPTSTHRDREVEGDGRTSLKTYARGEHKQNHTPDGMSSYPGRARGNIDGTENLS